MTLPPLGRKVTQEPTVQKGNWKLINKVRFGLAMPWMAQFFVEGYDVWQAPDGKWITVAPGITPQ